MQNRAIDEAGNIWELDATGEPVRMVNAPQGGRVFSLPPNPKEVRAERRADEDQQMQRENAIRAERAADRADKTAQRQAVAAERAAEAQAKPTEFMSKSAGFLGRMMQAERDFNAVPPGERGGRSLPRQTFHNVAPGLENTLMNSADRQKADQAVENFIAASLRQESGAAISPMEFERQYKIFFPAPGDSAEVLAQKANARRQAIEGFRIAAGPLADAAAGTAQQQADTEIPASDEDARAQLEERIARGEDPKATINWLISINRPPTPEQVDAIMANAGNRDPDVRPPETADPGSYSDSFVSQGLSGANEGLAGVLGAPVDLTTFAANLVPRGINALANTNIPTISNPIGGSEWMKDRLQDVGSVLAPSADPTKQFVRRVGESVGASAVPAGFAGSLGRAGAGLLAGFGGGAGGATAQQVAPGNPYAEILGEMAGSGVTGFGLLKGAQRGAQRGIEAAVPTVPQLKEQASDLYRAAESRGVVADPAMTQQLSDDFRAALAAEGRVSPTGRISEVYPKAREAVQLIDDYAGHTMNPMQIQNVRSVVGDALASPERAERRLGGILTDVLDEWAQPIAPELGEARNVASRYLTAEQLEKARELASTQASQFTGSGLENALRTQYRGLDRGAIKGTNRFNEDVTGAIEKVSRGTPTSNFLRGLGRLAPTGPVSGMASVVPGLAVGSMATPGLGAAVGGTMAGLGIAGRAGATHLGIKAADQAELIARNGGVLEQAPLIPDAFKKYAAWLAAVEQAKYLSGQR